MHCLVCFGIGTKYRCLGIKTVKAVCVCTLYTLFLAQQNVRAGLKKCLDSDSLTVSRLCTDSLGLQKLK